jgi:RsmE family RNA methyltransferase
METYFFAALCPEGSFVLSEEESKHLVKVRRHQLGDRVRIANGLGLLADCELTEIRSSRATLRVLHSTQHAWPEPRIHLAVSPLHHEDRWEWLLEKATELGVYRISPVLCERTEHYRWKLPRYSRILESALKQSLRTHLPILDQPMPLSQFQAESNNVTYVAHCDESADARTPRIPLDRVDISRNTCLMIGPEGDFHPSEIQQLVDHGALPLSLGALRLRTETAVIAGLSRFLGGSMQRAGATLLTVLLTVLLTMPMYVLLPLAFPLLISITPASAQSNNQRSNAAPVRAGHIALGRLKYQGGGDWYANPTSISNLAKFCNAGLGTSLSLQEEVADAGSPDLFRFPWVHMTGHGRVVFNEQEARNLRSYLTGGGFLHVDDNYGMDPYVRSEFKKVFPELEWTRLPDNHPVYLKPYPMAAGLPKIHEHDGRPAEGLGLLWQGRLVVYYSYQCDLGDGWEDASVHRDPETLRTTALQMGANLVRYAFEQ